MASNDIIIISDDEQQSHDVILIDDDNIPTSHVPTITESVDMIAESTNIESTSVNNLSTSVNNVEGPRPKKRRQVVSFHRLPVIHAMAQPTDEWSAPEGGRQMPFLFGQVSPFFHDEAACVEYLWHRGVFYTASPICSKEGCGKEMKLEVTLKRIRWRCTAYKCSNEQGIRKDTPFEGKKQELHKLLFLYRMLLDNEPIMRIWSYTGLNTRTISLLSEDLNELFLCDLASIPSK